MANPNTLSATSIIETTILAALTTAQVSILSNAAASGLLLKLNELVLSNITTSSVTALVKVYSAAALGGTGYQLLPSTTIPANTAIAVVSGDNSQNLVEDRSIGASCSVAAAVEVTGSAKILT